MRHYIRSLAHKAGSLLFVAATVDPFADAELLRRVRLARQFSEDVEVEVAFDDIAGAPSLAWPTPPAALSRLAKLRLDEVAAVRVDL